MTGVQTCALPIYKPLSRPVQYERAEQNFNTDIYCRMYRSIDEIKAYRSEERRVGKEC